MPFAAPPGTRHCQERAWKGTTTKEGVSAMRGKNNPRKHNIDFDGFWTEC